MTLTQWQFFEALKLSPPDLADSEDELRASIGRLIWALSDKEFEEVSDRHARWLEVTNGMFDLTQ